MTPIHVTDPTVVPGVGAKVIRELVGSASTGTGTLSVARMTSPPGWEEPAQTREFDEVTVVLEGTVVVVNGDLSVSGEVDGDVVMVGGSLRLSDGGRVRGDVRLLDALLMRDGGRVEGDVIQVEGREGRDVDEDTQEQIRQEVLSELRAEIAAIGEALGSDD